jgi:hypothetical protein
MTAQEQAHAIPNPRQVAKRTVMLRKERAGYPIEREMIGKDQRSDGDEDTGEGAGDGSVECVGK